MKTVVKTSGQLGPFLKHLRLKKRLSQTALGAKIGLSQERISRIENRPESVTLDQILTLMMALEATISVEENADASTIAFKNICTEDKEIW